MPKKPAKAKAVTTFALGDRVLIRAFGKGKIVELRGPLGPKGAQVYRVMYSRRPRPAYIEVLAEQLRLAPAPKPRASAVELVVTTSAPIDEKVPVGR